MCLSIGHMRTELVTFVHNVCFPHGGEMTCEISSHSIFFAIDHDGKCDVRACAVNVD